MRMTWLRLIALSVLLLVGVACSGGDDAPVPIENSTYRIGIPEPDPASDVKLHIFRDRDVIGGNVDDEDACPVCGPAERRNPPPFRFETRHRKPSFHSRLTRTR